MEDAAVIGWAMISPEELLKDCGVDVRELRQRSMLMREVMIRHDGIVEWVPLSEFNKLVAEAEAQAKAESDKAAEQPKTE